MPYRGPEGFSWHSSDVSTRRRALAAVVLLGAGWAIGFFAGRMSAWLFPVAETNTAVVANVTPPAAITPPSAQPPATPPRSTAQAPATPPAAPAESAPASQSRPDDKVVPRPAPSASEKAGIPEKAPSAPDTSTVAAETPTPAPDKSETAPAQRAAKVEPSAGAARDDTREQDAAKAPGRDVVLVNPEWKSQPDREPEPERRAYRPEPEAAQGRLADESALAKCESRYSSFTRSDGTYQPYGRSTREPCPFLSDMPRRRPRY